VVQMDGNPSAIVEMNALWHRRMIQELGPTGMDILIRVWPVVP
jgi:hypothetical protein